MKTKLVLWGTNAQDERVLIALELRPKDNKVDVYTFPESVATEEFSQKMMNEWRNDSPVDFPEGFTKSERELTVTESLLPEELKVERSDVIHRAQTEWHFVVLSTKLSEAYQHELAEFKEKVEKLQSFDDQLWAGLKNFWDKVQGQVRDRNLFKEHADNLRDHTNALFTRMKEMRNKLDEDFQRKSKDNMARFFGALEEVEGKIKEGLRLQPLFDKLKELQREFRDTEFTREHRSKVWERLDAAFKSAKGQREESAAAGGGGEGSPGERLQRRFEGLISAIEKMEQSIRRDREELDFQNRRIASTDGQLEAQIRAAKIKMIEERIRSKEEKLHEMNTTRGDLEKRLAQQRDRDAKRAERDKLEEAKKHAQEKIAQEIKAAAVAREAEEEKLAKAAEAISSEKGKKKPKKDSLLGAITTTLGESLEDAVDTVKAVAEVVGDKVEEAVEEAVEDIKEAWQEAKEAVAEAREEETAAETAAEEPVAEAEAEAPAEEPVAEAEAEAPAEAPAAEAEATPEAPAEE